MRNMPETFPVLRETVMRDHDELGGGVVIYMRLEKNRIVSHVIF
jgi:hypothetical protein